MNMRLILRKNDLEKSMTELSSILDAYVFMFSYYDDLHDQLKREDVRKRYDELKQSLSFPELEEKATAIYNNEWVKWKNEHLKNVPNDWQTFKTYIEDTSIQLIFMERALKRFTEPKIYQDLLAFLQKQADDNLQKELLKEEHRLTEPVEILLNRVVVLKEFIESAPLNNVETFRKIEIPVYEKLSSLLTSLKKEIDTFNTKDGKVIPEEFLNWRKPD